MLGRGASNDTADGARASVEDVIETVREERGGLVHCAVDDDKRIWVEVFGHELRDEGRNGRDLLGRLRFTGFSQEDARLGPRKYLEDS